MWGEGVTDTEKVMRGLSCCADGCGTGCPYVEYTDDGCQDVLCADALDLLKKYDDALKLMVYQYCTMRHPTANCEVFHNKHMSAGEAAFRLLGLKNWQSTDGVWEGWFPND